MAGTNTVSAEITFFETIVFEGPSLSLSWLDTAKHRRTNENKSNYPIR
jgi:hypothetical protein